MKKLMDLAFKLGCIAEPNTKTEYLALVQEWLIKKQKIIVIVECMVATNGISFKYKSIDARTGFYKVKDESAYIFATYKLALEAGVWNTLNYLR